MKTGKKTLAVIVALMMLLSIATMMASCAGNTPTDPSTSVDSSSTAEPSTNGTPVNDDEAIVLDFSDGLVAEAEVKESREITLRAMSNYLLIKGSGKFTVKVGDAEAIASDDQFEVKLENTVDVYTELVMIIQVDAAQTLTFTLVHNPGTEGNPHEIASSGETKVDYTEGVFVKVVDAGWYKITGNEFFVTNYIVGDDGVTEYQAYLPAGTYGISAKDKNAESSVTVSRVNAPEGYSEEAPKVVTELGDAKLTLFTGTKLYFQFNAPEDGLYVFSTGSEGKGANCRFAVSADDYATYYGRYYDNDQWLTCAGGKNFALHLVQNGTVTIMVDYTMDDKMVGSDEVSINISMSKVVEQLDELVSNTLEKKGKAYFSFTAEEAGTYTVQLGLGDTNSKCRIQIWTRELAEGREDTGDTYEWVKGDYCESIAYIKVDAGETVYIVIDSEKNAYGNVSVQVSAGAEEPLPSEGWESGTYKCDDAKIQLDRDAKTVALNNYNAVRFYYLDGKATFTANEVAYTLEMAENGKDIVLSYVNDEGETVSYTLVKVVPVEISKWQGVYVDAEGNEVTIFSDGAGIIGMKRYIIGDSGTKFTASENLLAWSGDYIIEINELNADGRAASIKVSVKKGTAVSETVIYTLKSTEVTAVPESLPIGNEKYVGGNDYNIVNGNINGSDVVVLKKIDDNTYMVSAVTSDYDRILMKVVIEKNDGKVVAIKLYNEKDELLSELAEPVIVATPELKTDGSKQDKSKQDQSFDGMYYVKITATGWYTFYGEESVEIFSATEVDGVASANWSTKYRLSTAGVTKQYNQGDVIAFYGGNFTASYSETEPVSNDPGTENNPYQWDGSDLKMDGLCDTTDLFYITYKAPSAGTYSFNFTKSGATSMQMYLTYNGVEYGRKYQDLGWETYESLPMVLELTAGQEITFAVSRGYKNIGGWTLTVEASGDQGGNDGGESGGIVVGPVGSNAEAYEWTATVSGTFTVNGTYGYLEIYTRDGYDNWGDPVVTLEGSGSVTLTKGETYVFVNSEDYEVTLTLVAEGGEPDSIEVGPVGSNAEAYEWTATASGTFTVNGTYGYLEIYTRDGYDNWGDPIVTLEGSGSVTLTKGETYVFVNSEDYEVTLTLVAEGGESDSIEVGPVGSNAEPYEWTATAGGTFTVNGTYGYLEIYTKDAYDNWGNPIATLEGSGSVTLTKGETYVFVNSESYDVTLTLVASNNTQVEDSLFEDGQEGTYVGSDGYVDCELTINADGTVNYEDSLGYRVENAIVEQSRDMLWLQFDCWGITVSIRFTNEESTQITMILDEVTVTLEKEGAADGDGLFSAEQQGSYSGTFNGGYGSGTVSIGSGAEITLKNCCMYNGSYTATAEANGYKIVVDTYYNDYFVISFTDDGITVDFYYSGYKSATAEMTK